MLSACSDHVTCAPHSTAFIESIYGRVWSDGVPVFCLVDEDGGLT